MRAPAGTSLMKGARGAAPAGASDAARRAFMYGRAATIYGGSNEVQKNITAKAVLGL